MVASINASQQPAFRNAGAAVELVENGGFDDATGWTVTGAGASIADGVFRCAGQIGNKICKRAPADPVIQGATYQCIVTVKNYTSGFSTPRVVLGGSAVVVPEWLNANGTYTGNVVAPAITDGTVGLLVTSSQVYDLDDLSIIKIADP